MRRVVRGAVLLIALPIVFVGTVLGHVILIGHTAPETLDDVRRDLDEGIPSLSGGAAFAVSVGVACSI